MATQITVHNLNIETVNGGQLQINELPAHSIALDGAVQGPVMGDDQDRWSFDHHAGCLRLITDATCQQIWKTLVLGLDVTDRPIYINDVDGDTLLSLWLLAHPDRVHENGVRNLVHTVGTSDAHGPAGAHLLTAHEQAMGTAFFVRLRDVLPRDVQAQYDAWESFIVGGFSVIESVLADASSDELGTGADEAPEMKRLFEGKRGGVKAILARAEGFGGFAPLYNEGFRVVVLCSEAADGSTRYTVGKLSDLVAYPLGPVSEPSSLLGRLAAREPGWGGGSSIGGSPHLDGGVSSRLTPEDVWEMMGC